MEAHGIATFRLLAPADMCPAIGVFEIAQAGFGSVFGGAFRGRGGLLLSSHFGGQEEAGILS